MANNGVQQVQIMRQGLRIGEVARRVGLSPKAVRYYEQIGLIPPPPRTESWHASSGYRLFSEADVRRLEFIRDARAVKLSLREIRDLLSAARHERKEAASKRFAKVLVAKLSELDRRIEELSAIRKLLAHAARRVLSQEKSGVAATPRACGGDREGQGLRYSGRDGEDRRSCDEDGDLFRLILTVSNGSV